MNCKKCGKLFVQDDPIYVINNDGEFDFTKIDGIAEDYETFRICSDCHDDICEDYPEFYEWWKQNTAILDVPDDEMDSSDWSERDYCSYFTTYDEADDETEN